MMKEIYWQFLDEIEGAEDYTRCATKCKDKNRELSSMYRGMAENELSHAEKLIEAMHKVAEMEEKKHFSDTEERDSYERDSYDRDKKKHYTMEAAEMIIDFMEGQLLKAKAMVSAFE